MDLLDYLLKYGTLIAFVGALGSFIFTAVKWLDQRRMDQEQRQHDAFHRMIALANGTDPENKPIGLVRQIAAIYQLQMYKHYAFASIPALEMLKQEFERKVKDGVIEPRVDHLFTALDKTLEILRKQIKL